MTALEMRPAPATVFESIEPATAATRPTPALRRLLIAIDLMQSAAGWAIGAALTGGVRVEAETHRPLYAAGLALVLTLATVGLIASQRLYLARVCSIRAVEINRLGRAALGAGVIALLVPRVLPVSVSAPGAAVGACTVYFLLMTSRGLYRHWLQLGRRDGRFLRSIAIVGDNEEGFDLFKLVSDHPELGFRVAAVISGDHGEDAFPVSTPRASMSDDLAERLTTARIGGVMIAASAFGADRLNGLVRDSLRHGLHVHVSSGLRGVDWRRIRTQPLAHEPLFYVEPIALAPWQMRVKRAVDVVGAAVGGALFALPVLAVAAVLIKLSDRGPVFYRQQRVGRYGEPFTILKLRTMVPDADKHYDALAKTKAGRNGPLIKIADDPRRTRIGRVLERFSIDELPQLLNVLKGEMSLVGPRPAQAREVAEFDERLLARLDVRPGITGLWQVEARDNPSYAAYRRYDLFYLENWSVALDLAILVATFQRVLLRGVGSLLGWSPSEVAPPPRIAFD